ncbi:hypothetical protein [Corynebacterium otitidis]|uniref:hypothetical protein n=1 Tax=Corynebacterium otitidis TaxID=29321 RepID=UPI0006279C1F|nr:hypothetical protein [Corynebacterium otitidis]KKO83561.1 hypothetical protein AAV33_05840 [Corynebacterium otitidis]
MRNRGHYYAGALLVLLALGHFALGFRVTAGALAVLGVGLLTYVIWTQAEGRYYDGRHARANRWVDTASVWIGALTVAVFGNWAGLILLCCSVGAVALWERLPRGPEPDAEPS